MLILVPSSETKREAPARGRAVDLDALSFPALAPMRRRVIDALVVTSAGPDAFARLLVGPSLAGEVVRNTRLRDLPTRPALEVYTGVLHEGLDAATLSTAAKQRAARRLLVASSLWGLLRPGDRIPPYRLNVCARLVGVEKLEPAWRTVLPTVLAEAAGPRGVILDVRSGSYQALGMAAGLGDRTVVLAHVRDAPGGRSLGSYVVKLVRGQVVRHVLESGEDPRDPAALAAVVASRWPVHLEPPERPGRPWTMAVAIAA